MYSCDGIVKCTSWMQYWQWMIPHVETKNRFWYYIVYVYILHHILIWHIPKAKGQWGRWLFNLKEHISHIYFLVWGHGYNLTPTLSIFYLLQMLWQSLQRVGLKRYFPSNDRAVKCRGEKVGALWVSVLWPTDAVHHFHMSLYEKNSNQYCTVNVYLLHCKRISVALLLMEKPLGVRMH